MFGLRRALCSRLQRNFQNHRVRASIFRNLGSATAPPRLFSCITLSGHFYRPHVPFVFNIFAAASNATALYMWRSNVLRLRKCSSAGGLRHGVARRPYSSEKSLPITDEEFNDALGLVLAERRSREGGNLRGGGVNRVPIGMRGVDTGRSKLTINSGLAVSGGVDSMALAFLYARARDANSLLPKAHGFVVDHKARPESTEEAHWVADQLRSKCRSLRQAPVPFD